MLAHNGSVVNILWKYFFGFYQCVEFDGSGELYHDVGKRYGLAFDDDPGTAMAPYNMPRQPVPTKTRP